MLLRGVGSLQTNYGSLPKAPTKPLAPTPRTVAQRDKGQEKPQLRPISKCIPSQQTACNSNVLIVSIRLQLIDSKGYKKLNFPLPFRSFRDILSSTRAVYSGCWPADVSR
jgi:hypothetical protein